MDACVEHGNLAKRLVAALFFLLLAAPLAGQAADAQPPRDRSGKEIVDSVCANCHRAGDKGAPRIGDREAWIPRLKRGLDLLVRSAINGHGPMPARGGLANLTDPELRDAILYMYNPVEAPAKGAVTPPPVAPGRNQKTVDGTEIYLGIISAESMRAQYPAGSKEHSVHGGIPGGRNYYHVNISLFDSKTRAAVTDAQVEVSAREPVSGGETKQLELVSLNSTRSYGNYFRMSGKNPYTITVRISRPGAPRPVEASFEFRPG